jgi:hypothetical protein
MVLKGYQQKAVGDQIVTAEGVGLRHMPAKGVGITDGGCIWKIALHMSRISVGHNTKLVKITPKLPKRDHCG